jgi:hypothetical protein
LYSVCSSWCGAFHSTRCPCQLEIRATESAEEIAEGYQKVHEATEEGTKEAAEVAKKGDERLE